MFAAMSFGNCGYAFPTIVGAKVAAPDRRRSRTSATARGA
jgi:thiamine pyrophosphate-dependent acetolactate synthase large subunit-like protein